eukprot:CAMPEP_0178413746 /NCGR_PEP_ID=MMETSP0689_2-20121128/22685_1 /TAXON_ID=160604 /ORGANISM="Amphidinium massartii, Strain CS-259" /LENGTH=399 /DNA_ID=CAMNT_0020035025 /DNA_START=57 /DNA_END=1255 /DNA_ORIENTATION=+
MALLWVDKHRPKTLDDTDYHKELAGRLARLAKSGNQPHMLFVGPAGAGKATRVHAVLRELYGAGVEASKVETRSVAPNPNNPSNTVDIQVVVSNYHMQLSPADVGHRDAAVVMQLIKEIAAHPPLGVHAFKVVVIEDAGALSNQAQAALRRTMEKYMKTCRIILTTDTASKIIAPLRSRCLPIRVSAPSVDEVCHALQKVGSAEGVAVPRELASRIAQKTGRDLRRALLTLETLHTQAGSSGLRADMPIPQEAWEVAIERCAKMVLQEQSPKQAMLVRGALYELLAACIPSDIILKELLLKLIAQDHDEELLQKAIKAAGVFETTMRQGGKDIFHLEAFVLRFMADYRALQNSPAMMGDVQVKRQVHNAARLCCSRGRLATQDAKAVGATHSIFSEEVR